MKKLLLISLFTIFNLEAATNYKKVVLASFKNKDVAKVQLEKNLDFLNRNLIEQKQKYPFDIRVREAGRYYILAIEPFRYVNEAKEVISQINSRYPSAFISNNVETFDETLVEKNEKTIIKEVPKKVEKSLKKNILKEKNIDEKSFIEELPKKVEKKEKKFTLADMVKEVLQKDPDIQVRLYEYKTLVEELNETKASYYPTVDLIARYGRTKTKNDSSEDKFSSSEITLELKQNLFNGFASDSSTSRDEARVKAAFYKYQEVAQDEVYKAIEAYLNVLKYKKILQIAKDNVKIHEETLVKIQDRYEKGFSTLSEVERVKGRLSMSKSNLVSETNNLYDAKFTFHRALGRFVDEKLLVQPKFYSQLPRVLEHAQDIAIHKNPSILVSNYDIKATQKNLEYSKRDDYPKLDLEIKASKYNDRTSSLSDKEDEASAMLVLSYNLYKGGADLASKQKNISTLNKEYENKNRLKREVIESLGLSWNANYMLQE